MEKEKWFIAGPCSAESFDQMKSICDFLTAKDGIRYIRAGIWKPRTQPGAFEGKGVVALEWLKELSKIYEYPPFIIEVATPEQVELALHYGIRNFWIGARTTVNPFLVQNIADAVMGVKGLTVFVKNPMHPDARLWLGAIERIEKSNANNVGAIHRGFYTLSEGPYRNEPVWSVPMQLKTLRKDLTIVCDVSHIAGDREKIAELVRMAQWLDYDALMTEVHPLPDKALSDAKQQLDFETFLKIHERWLSSEITSSFPLPEAITEHRKEIDRIDFEIIQLMARRMDHAARIGELKKIFQIPVFQHKRWREILSSRPEWALQAGLSPQWVERIWEQIHNESIYIQQEIIEKSNNVKIK